MLKTSATEQAKAAFAAAGVPAPLVEDAAAARATAGQPPLAAAAIQVGDANKMARAAGRLGRGPYSNFLAPALFH